ncbi:hypothetical protein DL767_002783 [Monosporascus sp. MG133]|nr:hypothetical protein DL767_002783 [Monosporascus sp. MG133]
MGLPLAKYGDQDQAQTAEQSSDQEHPSDEAVSETGAPEGTDVGRSEENQQILDVVRSTVVNPTMLRFSHITDILNSLSRGSNYGVNGSTSTSDAEVVRNGNTAPPRSLVRQDILDVLPPLPDGIPLLDFFEIFYTRVGGPGQTSVEEFSQLVADTCNIDGGVAYRKE